MVAMSAAAGSDRRARRPGPGKVSRSGGPSKALPEFRVIAFASLEEWEGWLEKNHASSMGIWLRIYKKDSGVKTIFYPEALDGALCYGWIDGLKRPFDKKSWIQRFTPRRPNSLWSKINTG